VLARPFADAVARDVAALVLQVEAAAAPRAPRAGDPRFDDPRFDGTRLDDEWFDAPAVPAAVLRPAPEPRGVDLLVVGAHLSGLPLHGRLRRHGALFAGEARTAEGYSLVALGDALGRPGMVREPGTDGTVLGELWRVPETALSALLLEAAAPLGLGRVTLDDGREVVGYLCEAAAADGKTPVADGDWRAFVAGATDA
jgi:allophanate hydrolase